MGIRGRVRIGLGLEYRDGIKSKGDKITMACTHSKMHVILSSRESTHRNCSGYAVSSFDVTI